MAHNTPRAKTLYVDVWYMYARFYLKNLSEEVFPATLPASATPPIHNTIVGNHIAPFYALGWRFSESELECHFDAQSEWDKTMSPMSDSQMAWVNPRWRPYAKELPYVSIILALD